MVSEMRAKVKNLEQKIHTRVPRLRMGSMSRPNPSLTTSNTKSSGLSSAGSSQSIKSPTDERSRSSLLGRRATDNDENKRTPANSSGWVLIMEDSPSPTKPKDRDYRRASSPPSAAGFHAYASLGDPHQLDSLGTPDVPSKSVQSSSLRRPQSRLSTSTEGRSSVSTTATVSSIPTPVSRPATPTFIPLPSSGLYAHPSTAGTTGLKRPSGPGFGGAYFKRSSLGSTTGDSPTSGSVSDSGISHRALSTSTSYATPSSTSSSRKDSLVGKSLPQIPHSNVTVRSHSKLPAPTGPPLSQSRIGRPNFGLSGRRSAGADLSDVEGRFLDTRDKGRPRSGSGRS
jgi:nuclear distribution protein NudE